MYNVLYNVPGCEAKPHIATRRSKSFKDLLLHTDHERTPLVPSLGTVGHFKCLHCPVCKYCIEGKEFVHPLTKYKYNTKHLTNCSSKYCIYIVLCECFLMYAGSSSRSVKVRILEHVARIHNRIMEAPLTSHFIENENET